MRKATGYWWVLLIAGIAWVAVALVILQFDQASVTTVGILVGLMFLALGVENIALSSWTCRRAGSGRCSAGFLVSAIVCFANPEDTFAGIADIRLSVPDRRRLVDDPRFSRARDQPALVAGTDLGDPDDGACLLDLGPVLHPQGVRAPGLAGIWALMQGITNMVRAFQIRAARGAVTELTVTEFKQDERLSRQQAAERLIDIAYALTAGGLLELIAAGRRITVPVEKELRLERWLRSNGDRLSSSSS